ncbi:MAG: diflavin oxidoreductase [Acidobacteriaceae bacterium]
MESQEPQQATHTSKYTRNNPFQSKVLVNELLTGPASEKETRHIELSLDTPVMTYTPGDAVGIVPTNRPEAVEEVLKALNFTGEERVKDHYGVEISLHEAVETRLAIGKLSRGSVNSYSKLTDNAELKALTAAENRAKIEEYLWGREFIDLIVEYPGVIKEPQQLFTVLQRLTPRMYSIASSQAMYPDVVHTTVRVVRYDTYGRDRQGVCSGLLGERAPVGSTLPIFLHSNNNFRLPVDPTTPIIMIGPGTGVAPFRAFLQHRMALAESGDTWLFFGEQREASDFLYKDEFLKMKAEGVLTRLDVAFSRDQAQKLYVQHRMREHTKELYEWLENGAYFYVCGDASRMAKDVETALLDAIANESGKGADYANDYLAQMKKQKRYQRDVY